MKTMSVRELQKRVRECVDVAQGERVVVTRHGRPAAVLIGVEGQDWEEVALRLSPSFWRMIERRRQEPTVSLAEAKRLLEARWSKTPSRAKATGSARKTGAKPPGRRRRAGS
jgi:prevent-host-death family protein